MATRTAKHYKMNPRIQVDSFNLEEITKDNIVNHMLVLTQHDVCRNMIVELFGSFNNGNSLVHHYDTFDVPPGYFKFIDSSGKEVSNSNSFTTTFGIWVFNIYLIQGFGFSKLFNGYINENINKGKFEKIHQKILYALVEDKISVESYKNFISYCDFIMPWETFLAPAQTEKLLACTKEIDKLKEKLIKQNKEAFDKGDPAVVEDIENQLIKFAKEYLKDDPALDAYESGAGGTFGNNFKNMYIMKGVIRDPDPNAEQEYHAAKSSFIDGISSDEYALLANSLAGGPYSRSKKTEIGGYWEKLIVAAMSSVTIEPGTDCGSDKYIEMTLTADMVDAVMYSYILKSNGKLEELTSDNVDQYINKKIKIRSVLFCKHTNGTVCNKCAGNFFIRRGNTNIGLGCSQVATKLKLTSMKSFHNSTIKTSTIDAFKAFSLK